MHDAAFVRRVLDHVTQLTGAAKARVNTWTRIHGVFTAVSEELPDVPLFYPLAAMVRACVRAYVRAFVRPALREREGMLRSCVVVALSHQSICASCVASITS